MTTAAIQPDEVINPGEVTITDRLEALLEQVIDRSTLNAAIKPMARNLALSYLHDMNEEEIKAGIEVLQNEVIPFILGTDQTDEDTIKE